MCFYIDIISEPSCGVKEVLVSGNNPIPDAHMTASSNASDFYGAPSARMINNASIMAAWLCSEEEFTALEPSMYIQVCFHVVSLFAVSSISCCYMFWCLYVRPCAGICFFGRNFIMVWHILLYLGTDYLKELECCTPNNILISQKVWKQ